MLDFATSRIAVGKVRVALNKGERVQSGTLLDYRGEPTTDPAAIFSDPHGAILPFGEHKGYGLAMVCELLGGALTGGNTLRFKRPPGTYAIINNMLSIIIDPQKMGTADHFVAESAAFIDWVMQSRVAQGAERIKTPGEPEREYRRVRGAEGIPIDANTWREIVEAAAKVGLDRAEVEKIAAVAS